MIYQTSPFQIRGFVVNRCVTFPSSCNDSCNWHITGNDSVSVHAGYTTRHWANMCGRLGGNCLKVKELVCSVCTRLSAEVTAASASNKTCEVSSSCTTRKQCKCLSNCEEVSSIMLHTLRLAHAGGGTAANACGLFCVQSSYCRQTSAVYYGWYNRHYTPFQQRFYSRV